MLRRRKGEPRRARGGEAGDIRQRLVTVLAPASAAAEAYRGIRTNLLYSSVDDPPKVVVVTSPGPGEGKSTTCANLGVTLAQVGKNTLIVDGDLRKPAVHRLFELRNLRGMTDVLIGKHDVHDVLQEPVPGLKVMCAGPPTPYPAEMLSTGRFAEFLDAVRQEFDHVLIDAPPTQMVSDPLTLANLSDGVLLVFDAQVTRKGALRRSVRSLEAVGGKVLGTIMNNAKPHEDEYYGYSYE